jgi:hypothetical protein
MRLTNSVWRVATLSILLWALTAAGQVTATVPYSVSVFATSVTGVYTQPDSIAVLGGHVFVGYGNNVSTTGSDGKSSTIVEYAMNGNVIKTYSVLGHNDGLRVNPQSKQLWALQNEDANPNLVIIDPGTGTQSTPYTFGPTPHGGGYDDMSFRNGDVFISASNPSNNPNTGPAIVKAEISGTTVNVSPVLLANANATDVRSGRSVTLNLLDPDSMIFDPVGDLVLDSQSDAELIIVRHPGFTDQSVFHLALPVGGAKAQVDDTVFVTSSKGVILVSDRDGETVYSISEPIFASGAAYAATPNSVGRLNLDTGVITPIVTGMVSPHGMAFILK